MKIEQVLDGNVIKEWHGLNEIKKTHPEWKSYSNIPRMLNDENRKMAYGFEWRIKK